MEATDIVGGFVGAILGAATVGGITYAVSKDFDLLTAGLALGGGALLGGISGFVATPVLMMALGDEEYVTY